MKITFLRTSPEAGISSQKYLKTHAFSMSDLSFLFLFVYGKAHCGEHKISPNEQFTRSGIIEGRSKYFPRRRQPKLRLLSPFDVFFGLCCMALMCTPRDFAECFHQNLSDRWEKVKSYFAV